MVSEACCNRNRTQAVFPEPVIPAIMEVKGCSKRNRWHFCENIGTVWNGVRPALRCLDITCLCILSFLLKDFSQTEQNQLMSTPQEQNVDWERGRMLRTYIGFQAIKFNCFPLPRPPLPHFNCFPSSSTTATTTFLLFFFPPLPPPPHFNCFPSTRFYKWLPTVILSSFCSNVSCSEPQSWFSSAVSRLPCLSDQRQFLLKTATPQQLHALVQVLYNVLMGHIPTSEENKRILLP